MILHLGHTLFSGRQSNFGFVHIKWFALLRGQISMGEEFCQKIVTIPIM